jgi:hypothetical protein
VGTTVLDTVRDVADSQYFAGDWDDVQSAANSGGAVVNKMLAGKMQPLVKGVGYSKPGGNQPLQDDEQIFRRSMKAERLLTKAVKQGLEQPGEVIKGLSPEFSNQFGSFLGSTPQNYAMTQFLGSITSQIGELLGKDVSKNFTLPSPLASGLVPFDLVAPSRLIYPVYSPIRNKLARIPGQGTSRRTKVITGVSGSQTGPSGGKFINLGIPELVTGTGSMQNWPLNLPGSGTQDAVDLNVPYKFWGLSESLSWLAQFGGQGFEDISALANLILLQQFMLSEEAMHLAATSTVLTTPTNPTLTARSANSGEAALTGVTTNVFVKVTAATWFGETTTQTSGASVAWSAGQVVDVTIVPTAGAQWYNIYVTTGASAGTYYLMASQVGGLNFTLQGALPTSGTVVPASDTGTGSTNSQEGIIPVLTGHSQGSGQVYPANWQGGYINQSVGDTLHISNINNMLAGLWDGTSSVYGAYRADPAEIIGEGGDLMRLSNDIVNTGTTTNYRLFVEQTEVPGVRAGAAVSEFQNPITRSIIKLLVHPWLPQGTAMAMSYTLPFAWSNVSNVWEFVAVQDYLSISWPVIDATFRFSMFMYGALVANAPQYCGIMQGIQKSDRSGSTGTWS